MSNRAVGVRYRYVVIAVFIALFVMTYLGLRTFRVSSTSDSIIQNMDKNEDIEDTAQLVTMSPEIVNRELDYKVIPTEDELLDMNRKDVSQLYHDYVNTAQISCKETIRPGKPGDGGWDVCVDPKYSLNPPCLVYSFGINYDFSFDDDVADKYGCEVYSYDPSMVRMNDHLRGHRVHFHKTGLNDSDGINSDGWRMRTFSSILKENFHSHHTIDLLKIDIECSELWALPEMLRSGSLHMVKQLCFEMHIKRIFQPEPDKMKYIFGLSILRELYKEGFRIFKSHRNMYPKYTSIFGMERTGCHEIYMIRQLK